MARGTWSFLHEWVIYDYLMQRFEERTLRLKCTILRGKIQRRERWVKVLDLKPIASTDFPDVKCIRLEGIKNNLSAEVKFTTSLFNYHKNKNSKFNKFLASNGFILVLSHDYLPPGLRERNISVYELDKSDFIAFCRENFIRLLNRQIKRHTETKVWLMYQGDNFNKSTSSIKPSRKSLIWCPTENLTSFDLAIGDRILFIKTKGAPTQTVQKEYFKGIISKHWTLSEIWVGGITSTIYSREEYCQLKKIPITTQLWKRDPKRGSNWRWERVFSFKKIKEIKLDIPIDKLWRDKVTRSFVEAVVEIFCFNKSREISLEEYRNILEKLVGYEQKK